MNSFLRDSRVEEIGGMGLRSFAWMVMGLSAFAEVRCTDQLGGTNDSGPDGLNQPDVGADVGADVNVSGDAAMDASADVSDAMVTTYNDITDGANWTTFDIASVASAALGFAGGTFDGRYVYLAPTCGGSQSACATEGYSPIVVRYDTMGPFAMASSWSTFDLGAQGITSNAPDYLGATYDGRYVYYIPYSSMAGLSGNVVRYDTTLGFTTKGAWTSFDVSTVQGGAYAFAGGVYDGSRYLYLIGGGNPTAVMTVRYDTTASFTVATSYLPYNTTAVTGAGNEYFGGVSDGHYLYLTPWVSGLVVRYDTTATFNANGSWTTFDLAAKINASANTYNTAGYDGHYVYFTPWGQSANGHLVVQYDTMKTFSDLTAWQSFDTTMANAGAQGFRGCSFDGRFMYFAPNANMAGSIVTRYDTTAAFNSPSSWSVYDTTKTNPNAKGFLGTIFDGQYVYFVPLNNGSPDGVVARFKAKSPPSMPKGYSGSFF